VGEYGRAAPVIGLTGQLDVHFQYAAVQLFYQRDGFILRELKGRKQACHFGQDGLERRQRFALLGFGFTGAALLLLVVRLTVSSLGGTAIYVAPVSSAHVAVLSVTAR
jgi:hypothetical protein